ncbi:hypothetical protein DMJ13_17240 [halophilic archaeon]|nr:hypothetical protein DMJ13_17240 [halophilic archaeon]
MDTEGYLYYWPIVRAGKRQGGEGDVKQYLVMAARRGVVALSETLAIYNFIVYTYIISPDMMRYNSLPGF